MAFIKNGWYIAAWSSEITDKPLARTLGGDPIVIYRDAAGKAGALLDRCCHRGAPLSLGEVVDKGLQCNYHGLIFSTDGSCVHIPGQDRIPTKACVRSYPLVERDETLWIWLGDPKKADPSSILDYPFNNDHKKWPHQYGLMHIKGHYMHIIDNLMDLTHLGFVHKKTIGSGAAKAYVDALMKTERTETGVRITRWFLDHEPPATYVKAVGFKGKVDRWQEFEFVAPGNVVQFSGATDAGTGAYDQDKRDGGFALRILHSVTPETETSCHYFFAPANGYKQEDPDATAVLFDEIYRTFLEDKLFIEQQQERLNVMPEPQIDIVSDGARIQGRRYYEERLAQERAESISK